MLQGHGANTPLCELARLHSAQPIHSGLFLCKINMCALV